MLTKQLKLACLLSFSCFATGANPVGNDSAFIVVKILNSNTGSNHILGYSEAGSYFTKYSYTSSSSRNRSSGPIYRISADYPLKFTLFASVKGIIEGAALPGDTTLIELDMSKPEDPARFTGKSADVCEFYKAAKKESQRFYFRDFSQNSINSYINYFIFLEGKYQGQDSFYNDYVRMKKLPEWFGTFHKTNLIYEKGLAMVENIHTINYNNRIKVYPTPEFLLWFRDVPIDNPAAVKNQVYFDFLWQYFLWKSNIIWNRTSGGKVNTDWFARILPAVNQELKDPVKEWFLKELIINFYAAKDLDEVDAAFSLVNSFIKNKDYLLEITQARNRASELREQRFAKAAKVGSKAPALYLVDSLNNTISLDKLTGQWIFFRFFNERTFSPEAVNADFMKDTVTFDKDRIRLVNVYTSSNKDVWKKSLSKFPNSGNHLFCKGNWGEMVTFQYGLRSYPYWVLVDPQGIIQYSGIPDFNSINAVLKNN